MRSPVKKVAVLRGNTSLIVSSVIIQSGVPCVGPCQKTEQLRSLPVCQEKIVQYSPRIDHVGYRVQCPVNPQ